VRGQVALFKVDLDTNRTTTVSKGEANSQDFEVAADGKPAAEVTYDGGTGKWAVKVPDGVGWRQAQTGVSRIGRPGLWGLGRDGSSILVGLPDGDSYAERELSADGASFGAPLAGPIGGTIVDPVTHRLIGLCGPDGDHMRYVFFDAEDQVRWQAVQAAFPGDEVGLTNWSDDRKTLVVHVQTPSNGPAYALVDLEAGSLQWLGAQYPGLAGSDFSPPKPVSFKATDGLLLTGSLVLPAGKAPTKLPLIVYPNRLPGEPSAGAFNWWGRAMASRGYAVLQINQRGSAGRSPDLMTAGAGEWGRKMQTDLADGVLSLVAQGIVDQSRVCVFGTSYGGYAALAAAASASGYRCAVDVAGPTELPKFIAFKTTQGGASQERFWEGYAGANSAADPTLLAISPADHADKVSIPILIIQGKDDTVVPFEQSQIMADALKKAGKPYDFVVLNHEDHWLSHSDTRLQMLQATMDFLAKNNPAE
jgi:dipeptidyl aminopeptidase/acylaminoacyl peptidase